MGSRLLKSEHATQPVIDYALQMEDEFEAWDAAACDRPYSVDWQTDRVRLFDYRWLTFDDLRTRLNPANVNPRSLDDPWQLYQHLAANEQIGSCRRLAGAIMEALDACDDAVRLLRRVTATLRSDFEASQ